MSRLVEGCRLPHAVAGHPALELCNTRAIWWTAGAHRVPPRLRDPGRLRPRARAS